MTTFPFKVSVALSVSLTILKVIDSPSGSEPVSVMSIVLSSSTDKLISWTTGGFKNWFISDSKFGMVAAIPKEV